MSHVVRRLALVSLLVPLAVGPVIISKTGDVEAAGPATAGAATDGSAAAPEMVGPFATTLKTEIADKLETLKLTGTAFRKKFGIKFYQIAGYCCSSCSPKDVDALAAADVPKQLILVLERDISENILRRSFEAALEDNDPEKKFIAESKKFLDHMAANPLKKGERITITHLPGAGMEVRVGDGETCRVEAPAFAHVVWNVYMGPQGVCPVLREGLGERLMTN